MKCKLKISFRLLSIIFLLLTVFVAVGIINKKNNFLNKAYIDLTGENADLAVDVSNSGSKIERRWVDFAQGGEEKGGMFEAVIPQVKILKPRYIRIDHIYDFYDVVERDIFGNLVYNWEKLDEEINDILKMGAKPFISLSYMPSSISVGTEVDVPTDWSDWQEVVKSTIEHISGVENLAIFDVYYEVWNEPDLFGKFKMGKDKDYLVLYKYAALGAREAQKTLPYKLGGPGTTGLYRNWFDGLITYTKKENLRLDFFSWHRYSKNISDYEADLLNTISWKKDLSTASTLEMIISECGVNSDISSEYDSVVSAIHTLSLFTLSSNYQNLKVFTFEVKDGPGNEQFWGRWGLLTHEKFGAPVEKPRYKAIEFLNFMEGDYVPVRGQGTWVKAFAVKDKKNIRVLIVNYDMFGEHSEFVPIQFDNLDIKDFTFLTKEFLGEEEGVDVSLDNESWKTSLFMKPNSAVILELIERR